MENGITLFTRGGLVMYPLFICSVFVLTIALERWFYYRSLEIDVEKLVTEVTEALQKNNKQQACQLCEQISNPVASVLIAGLRFPGKERIGIKEAMEEEALNRIVQLKVHLNYLDTIITLAPLLGLLGTVTGMINSFNVLNVSSNKPFAITGGVAEALIATATGLAIAITALIFYSYFTNRVDKFIYEIERSASKMLGCLSLMGGDK